LPETGVSFPDFVCHAPRQVRAIYSLLLRRRPADLPKDVALAGSILDLPEARAFVADHYGADIEIYRDDLAARSVSAAS